jgi:hypothetical protein
MKLSTYKAFLLALVTISLLLAAGTLTAQVYKTVDEEGNVTFTDQPPGDGSQPIELRPLSIIEAPTYQKPVKSTEEATEGEGGKEMSLGYMRKNYADFAIVAPQQEESVWHPEDVITVAWNARYQLQPGMQVTVSVDGVRQTPTTEQVIAVTGLERGEHTVTAELTDAKNRRVAMAEPVTFFIRRPGLYNRPRPTPRGG